MKKFLLVLSLLFLFGCAETIHESHDDTIKKYLEDNYVKITLVNKEMPKVTLMIPKYAYPKIKDFDEVSPNFVSEHNKNIIMIYFDKYGTSPKDLGHAVAITFILKDAKAIPFLFQTTIQEEQRFFIYNSFGLPQEVSKQTYKEHLQYVIDGDRKETI